MPLTPLALQGKLRTWRLLPPSGKWLSLELAYELALARIQVSFVPFRIYARDLGVPRISTEYVENGRDEPDTDTLNLLRLVQSLTESLSTLLPWNCTCLVRAMAAYRVLGRRGCRASLRLGVRKSHSDLEAHAWLSHGGRIITGRREAGSFSPLAQFHE